VNKVYVHWLVFKEYFLIEKMHGKYNVKFDSYVFAKRFEAVAGAGPHTTFRLLVILPINANPLSSYTELTFV
jgi:hypothetical protein